MSEITFTLDELVSYLKTQNSIEEAIQNCTPSNILSSTLAWTLEDEEFDEVEVFEEI